MTLSYTHAHALTREFKREREFEKVQEFKREQNLGERVATPAVHELRTGLKVFILKQLLRTTTFLLVHVLTGDLPLVGLLLDSGLLLATVLLQCLHAPLLHLLLLALRLHAQLPLLLLLLELAFLQLLSTAETRRSHLFQLGDV
jgi:hypothetical protein